MRKILYFFLLFFLFGCSDNSITKKYKQNLVDKQIDCLSMLVFPSDQGIEDSLNKLYDFNDSCNYKLQVSKKGGIICNSSHNLQKKVLNNFPSGYLKMNLYSGNIPLYNYYIDLKNEPTSSDVERAFSKIREELHF